jgi:haloacid dehalogenase superfamily, subfamily IA, variant 3 with third motif having DD or ED
VEIGAIEVVLFDLGGVLIDFGGVAPMKELAGIETDDELWRRWLTCRWVRRFERGQCSAHEFAVGVVDDWNLSIASGEFLDAFASWPGGPLPGADALLRSVQQVVPAGCLSNTNALHWELHSERWPIFDVFDYRFLSFELGIVKPDRAVFDRVAQLLPAPPGRVLFIDDNVLNVEGAAEAGFVAVQAQGVAQAAQALRDAGVLRASAS